MWITDTLIKKNDGYTRCINFRLPLNLSFEKT